MESSSVSTPTSVTGFRSVVDAFLEFPRHLTIFRTILFWTTILLFGVIAGTMTATLLLSSIFIHETGHLWAARRKGIETRGMVITPFGAIGFIGMIPNDLKEVYIAIMGPLWGLATAVILSICALVTDSQYLIAISFWVCFINIFNLIPISPLDGGRVVGAFAHSYRRWLGKVVLYAGPVIAGALFILVRHPILLVVAIISYRNLGTQVKDQKIMEPIPHEKIVKASAPALFTLLTLLLLAWFMYTLLEGVNPLDILIQNR